MHCGLIRPKEDYLVGQSNVRIRAPKFRDWPTKES